VVEAVAHAASPTTIEAVAVDAAHLDVIEVAGEFVDKDIAVIRDIAR
jgi:hypothetical protein